MRGNILEMLTKCPLLWLSSSDHFQNDKASIVLPCSCHYLSAGDQGQKMINCRPGTISDKDVSMREGNINFTPDWMHQNTLHVIYFVFILVWFGCVLWHMNPYRLFNAKTLFRHTRTQTHTHTFRPFDWGCRIHRLHLCRGVRHINESPGKDTEQSVGEVPVILELWRMCSIPSLPSLSAPPRPGVIAPDRVLSMGQIELICVFMLNWIIWNKTVFDI